MSLLTLVHIGSSQRFGVAEGALFIFREQGKHALNFGTLGKLSQCDFLKSFGPPFVQIDTTDTTICLAVRLCSGLGQHLNGRFRCSNCSGTMGIHTEPGRGHSNT